MVCTYSNKYSYVCKQWYHVCKSLLKEILSRINKLWRIELLFCMCGYIYIYICINCKIALGYISAYLYISMQHVGLPWWLSGKESTCNAGDLGLIPGSGRSPEGETGNSFQYSCLENPMDRRAWWATVHWITKSQTQLSNWAHTQAVYIVWGLFEQFWKCIYMECMYTYIYTWEEG